MTRPVFYVAHPVAYPCKCRMRRGDTLPHETLEAEALCNLARAKRWLRWLLERTDVALCAPWMPYVEILPDGGEWRERGLLDDCAMAARCDGIILCGGRISSGMERNWDAVRDGLLKRRHADTLALLHSRGLGGVSANPPSPMVSSWLVDITKLGPEPPIGEFMLPPILCPQ